MLLNVSTTFTIHHFSNAHPFALSMHSYVNTLIYGTCAMKMNAYKAQPIVQTIIGDDAIANPLVEQKKKKKRNEKEKKKRNEIRNRTDRMRNYRTYTYSVQCTLFRGSYGIMAWNVQSEQTFKINNTTCNFVVNSY